MLGALHAVLQGPLGGGDHSIGDAGQSAGRVSGVPVGDDLFDALVPAFQELLFILGAVIDH